MSQDKSNNKIQHTAGPWNIRQAKMPSDRGLDWAIFDEDKKVFAEAFEVVGHGIGLYDDRRPAEGNANLLALALTAPHSCDVPDCPGPKNLAKLKAAEDLAKVAIGVINSGAIVLEQYKEVGEIDYPDGMLLETGLVSLAEALAALIEAQ